LIARSHYLNSGISCGMTDGYHRRAAMDGFTACHGSNGIRRIRNEIRSAWIKPYIFNLTFFHPSSANKNSHKYLRLFVINILYFK
ncbi:MAG: hypothetical protein L0G80_12765, partial [Shewanella sp.]|uniref:hypothetical protein n=1 Tax=Shewanella sp. TaxID=50422 RepID=UPI0026490233